MTYWTEFLPNILVFIMFAVMWQTVSVAINTFLIGVLGKAAACPHTPGITTGLSSIIVVCTLTFRQLTACRNGSVDTLFCSFMWRTCSWKRYEPERPDRVCLHICLHNTCLHSTCLHNIWHLFTQHTFVYMTLFTQHLFAQHLFTHLFTQHLITLGRSLSTAMFRSDTYRSHDFLLGITFMLHGSVNFRTLLTRSHLAVLCVILSRKRKELSRIKKELSRILYSKQEM